MFSDAQINMDSEKVWLSDPTHGFILGRIVEFAEDGPVVQPIERYGRKYINF